MPLSARACTNAPRTGRIVPSRLSSPNASTSSGIPFPLTAATASAIGRSKQSLEKVISGVIATTTPRAST